MFSAVFFGVAVFKSAVARILSLIAALAAVAFLAMEPLTPNNTLLYSGFWFAGAVCALRRRSIGLLAVAGAYVCLCVASITAGGVLLTDLAVAVAVVVFVLFADAIPLPALLAQVGEHFSEFSFSLYLFHMPTINTAVSLGVYYGWVGDGVRPNSPTGWLAILALAVLSLAVSKLMFALFEARTPDLRRWLLAKTVTAREIKTR